MATITSCNPSIALVAILNGLHRAADEYKIALIKRGHTRDYNKITGSYDEIQDDEVVAPGYTTGGKVLLNRMVNERSDYIEVLFDIAEWPNSTIAADGAMIYNATDSNAVLALLSFGGCVNSTNDSFTVTNNVGAICAYRLRTVY
jgi:hypothetical protein